MKHAFRFAVLLAVAPGLLLPTVAPANNPMDLPDMGRPSDAAMSRDHEAQIGRMVLRQLRDAGMVIEDPQVDEYIQSIGHRIAAHAHDGEFRFRFFVVDDGAINAFAVPGGYIGINRGLLDATRNESELAGVLAHEIAHVTQRHISRQILAQRQSSMVAVAGILAAAIIGMLGGADAAMGAMAMGQSMAIEQQISHTRAHEHEADRVGIRILASAGFDPEGLPRFFEVLQRRYGMAQARVPQFLQTHPVTTDRISEGMSRARQMDRPPESARASSMSYELTKARLRVLSTNTPRDAVSWFNQEASSSEDRASQIGVRYGRALAATNAGMTVQAISGFRELIDEHPEVVHFHIGLAQAYAAEGQRQEALEVFRRALAVSPRNLPLTIHYAETLMADGHPDLAHRVLLDLLNTVPPTPEQIRLIALAASASGEDAEANYYMAEYHIANGNAHLAINQLRMALASTSLNSVQQARFRARIDWILDAVPDEMRRELERQASAPLPMPSPQRP